MSTARILAVDDEPEILSALGTILRGAGYEIDTAASGKEALAQATLRVPDAVILDLVLPDQSGIEVCRELRTWTQIPIVLLSVVGDEEEKVEALDAGADDYVTKPFAVNELLARLRAALRRAGQPEGPVVEIGELRIDLDKQAVFRRDSPVRLTPQEFKLLAFLARNEGRLLTHRMILREVWGPAYQTEMHYVHVYVSRLRQKIEDDPSHPQYIVTESSFGYRLVGSSIRAG
ncbi:MAG TPA: response regulator transcription factor [Gaiellaceae bacterium]|jgi:two-component system KDP operon response regulator KdpE